MVSIKVSDQAALEQNVHSVAFFLEEGFSFSKELKEASQELFPSLKELIKQRAFTGKQETLLVVPVALEQDVMYLILVGLGKKDKKIIDIEYYRRSLAKLIKSLSAQKIDSCAMQLPSAQLFGAQPEYLAQQTANIVQMADYHFDDFITNKEKEHKIDLILCVDSKNKKATETGVKIGQIIAQSVNKARYWVDTPPSRLTPPHLADKARAIAKKYKLKITVFNEDKINEMGMGGLAGVSRGSDVDCKLVILEYKTKKKNAPTLAFVGKGITFDSGGLSLKPPRYMETMKEDMSGAAAVIATMEAIAQLKPEVNVIGVTPLAENLPSGKATKPGDIVCFYNGKTAEVKNTDAEGRLVLADALAYTVKHYKPDMMIDLATLTGACAHALGPFFSCMMSQHDALVKKVEAASQSSGDRVWRLPFDNDYKKAIQSPIADICNIGDNKYMAGAITAGFFLQNFVGKTPWVHLDIAGTAFNVPDRPYYRPGATGVGVRLLVDLAMNWK